MFHQINHRAITNPALGHAFLRIVPVLTSDGAVHNLTKAAAMARGRAQGLRSTTHAIEFHTPERDRINFLAPGIQSLLEPVLTDGQHALIHVDDDLYALGRIDQGLVRVYSCLFQFPPANVVGRDGVRFGVHFSRHRLIFRDARVSVQEVYLDTLMSRTRAGKPLVDSAVAFRDGLFSELAAWVEAMEAVPHEACGLPGIFRSVTHLECNEDRLTETLRHMAHAIDTIIPLQSILIGHPRQRQDGKPPQIAVRIFFDEINNGRINRGALERRIRGILEAPDGGSIKQSSAVWTDLTPDEAYTQADVAIRDLGSIRSDNGPKPSGHELLATLGALGLG